MNFPDEKYQIIYADPPWDVAKIKRKVRPNQIEMDYPIMPLGAIKNLPVNTVSDINSCLFLWATHAYLPHAFGIMDAWGFRYQRVITWDKSNGMCLFGFHHRTEFLLFGYKGKIEMYPRRKAFPTLITAKSDRHSGKPPVFRGLIEPFGKTRIELFAREEVDGWDALGNEIDGMDIQDSLDLLKGWFESQ